MLLRKRPGHGGSVPVLECHDLDCSPLEDPEFDRLAPPKPETPRGTPVVTSATGVPALDALRNWFHAAPLGFVGILLASFWTRFWMVRAEGLCGEGYAGRPRCHSRQLAATVRAHTPSYLRVGMPLGGYIPRRMWVRACVGVAVVRSSRTRRA